MASIKFQGVCSGTVEKISTKTGNPYKVTSFTDYSCNPPVSFQVFGDLGLPQDLVAREWVLEGGVVNVNNIKVVSGPAVKVGK